MKKLFSKSLLVGAAMLALAPMSAFAFPPDCDLECYADWAACSQRCWFYGNTTCGQFVASYGDFYPENSCSPSATDTEQQEASVTTPDASTLVCSQAEQVAPSRG